MRSLRKTIAVFLVLVIGIAGALLFRKKPDEGATTASKASSQIEDETADDSEGDDLILSNSEKSGSQGVPLPSDAATTSDSAASPNNEALGGVSPSQDVRASTERSVASGAVDQPSEATDLTVVHRPPVLPPRYADQPPLPQIPIPFDGSLDSNRSRSGLTEDDRVEAANPMSSPLARSSVPNLSQEIGSATIGDVHAGNARTADQASSVASSAAGGMLATRTHTIVNGDTLARLARRYLGSEDRHGEIFRLNQDILLDPELLPIGREIKIPPRQLQEPRTSSDGAVTSEPEAPPLVPLPPGAVLRR